MAHRYSFLGNRDPRWPGMQKRAWKTCGEWLRIFVEAVLFIMVIVLLQVVFQHQTPTYLTTSGLVPAFSTKPRTFERDETFIDGQSFLNQTHLYNRLSSWMALTSKARGFVDVAADSWEQYNLLKPHNGDPFKQNKTASAHMVAVFHQLHCLSSMIEYYHRLADLDEDKADHMAHCFDYLRQSILCSADTTLEGYSNQGGGFGVRHQCVNYDEVLDWANDHSPWDWVDGPKHL